MAKLQSHSGKPMAERHSRRFCSEDNMQYFRTVPWVALLMVVLSVFSASALDAQTSATTSTISSVTVARAARLRHGINASN